MNNELSSVIWNLQFDRDHFIFISNFSGKRIQIILATSFQIFLVNIKGQIGKPCEDYLKWLTYIVFKCFQNFSLD